jgi:uncharacterized protein YchJ
MKNEKADEKTEFVSKAGKPNIRWFYVDPISRSLPHSKDSWNQGTNKQFFSNEKLKENMTATYWG